MEHSVHLPPQSDETSQSSLAAHPTPPLGAFASDPIQLLPPEPSICVSPVLSMQGVSDSASGTAEQQEPLLPVADTLAGTCEPEQPASTDTSLFQVISKQSLFAAEM